MMTEINSLISENKKLREYVSLLDAELELLQRVFEIQQNFENSYQSRRIIEAIFDRISKIRIQKLSMHHELNLN